MAILYNKNTGKNEQVTDNSVQGLLNRADSPYIPIPSSTYSVYNSISGRANQVSGNELYSYLNNGYEIKDESQERAEDYVRETGSPLKEFMGNFVDEAATFGVGEEIIRNLEKNPYKRSLLDARRKVHGKSRAFGGILGFAAPLVVTGGASLLGRSAAKTGVKGFLKDVGIAAGKGAKLAPTSVLVRSAHAAGKAGAKVGAKGGAIGKGIGYGLGSAAVEGGIYGTAKGLGSIVEDLASGEKINTKDAFSEGLDRGIEISKWSALIGGGILGGGAAAVAGVKGIAKVGSKVGKVGIDALAKSRVGSEAINYVKDDLGKVLTSKFFNQPRKFSAKKDLVNTVNKNRLSLQSLPDDDLVNFYKGLGDDVKIKYGDNLNAEQIRTKILGKGKKGKDAGKVLQDLVDNGQIKEGDVFGLYASTLKKLNVDDSGRSLGFPKTLQQAGEILEKAKKKLGKELEGIRKIVQRKQTEAGEYVAKKQKQIIGKDDIPNFLTGDDIHHQSFLDETLLLSKEKLLPRAVQLFKEKTSKLATDSKKFIGDASEASGIWLLKQVDGDLNNILKLDNFAAKNPAKYKQNIIAPLRKAGLKPREVDNFLADTVNKVRSRNHLYELYSDAERLRVVFGKPSVSYKDVLFLDDISKRYAGVKTQNNKIKNLIKEYTDSSLGKAFFIGKGKVDDIINDLRKTVSEVEQSTVSSPFFRQVKKIEQILDKKDNITLFDLHEIKDVFDDLAKFDKLKGATKANTRARDLSRELSKLEDEIIDNVRKIKGVEKHAKNFQALKKDYSLIKTVQKYTDVLETANLGVSSKEIATLALGGVGALLGGLPGGLIGGSVAIAGDVALKKGLFFLTIGDAMKNGTKTFRKMSNPQKLKNFFNHKATKAIKLNIVEISEIAKIMGVSAKIKNLDELAHELNASSEAEQYYMELGSRGYGAVRENGGEQGVAKYAKSMGDLVAITKQIMPKGHLDPVTRKRTFTKSDELEFRSKMNLFARPESFLQKAKQGNLSEEDRLIFQSFYPTHYEDFISNFTYAVQNKEIKLTRGILNTYNRLLKLTDPKNLVGIDNANNTKKQQQMKQARQGGIKFKSTEQNHETLGNRIENL